MALVLDTGVVYAALYADDPEHARCAGLIEGAEETLIVPEPALVELDYWLRKAGGVGAWRGFCEDLDAGAYTLFHLAPADVLAAAELQERYADQPIGFVDAAVALVCDLLGEKKVATLDRRHFSVLRTRRGESLELLP